MMAKSSLFEHFINIIVFGNVTADSCLGGYDARPECERPGLNALSRHWIFRSVRTHCYIWWPMWGSSTYFCSQSVRTHFLQREVNVTADSCLGGLVVMTLNPECERPGFDPPLRHWIFRSVGTHCYSKSDDLAIITIAQLKRKCKLKLNWHTYCLTSLDLVKIGAQKVSWEKKEWISEAKVFETNIFVSA